MPAVPRLTTASRAPVPTFQSPKNPELDSGDVVYLISTPVNIQCSIALYAALNFSPPTAAFSHSPIALFTFGFNNRRVGAVV